PLRVEIGDRAERGRVGVLDPAVERRPRGVGGEVALVLAGPERAAAAGEARMRAGAEGASARAVEAADAAAAALFVLGDLLDAVGVEVAVGGGHVLAGHHRWSRHHQVRALAGDRGVAAVAATE